MNPLAILLMIAMLATAGVLFVGLAGFFIGGDFNERYGNRLMRARVGLQLLAVTLLGLLFLTQH
jgi:Hypoxia induced protein conserved region